MLILSFAIIAFAVFVDQITKNAALSVIGIGGQPYTVVENFFYIVCHRNSGAAWGMLKDARVFFVALTSVMLIVMFVALIRYKDPFLRVALAFVIGGAIGNYIDRLIVGSVVDFLDFYIFGYNFPTFNAADSSIVLGAALLIIYSARIGGKREAAGKTDGADNGADNGADISADVKADENNL